MCDYFPRLAERTKTLAGSLSGGEQRMPTICRSLLENSRVILIDEPTEVLAPKSVDLHQSAFHGLDFSSFAGRWKCSERTGSLSGKADGHDRHPAVPSPFALRGWIASGAVVALGAMVDACRAWLLSRPGPAPAG